MTATNAMLAALAAKPVDGTNIIAGYPSPPDTIASTPAFVLGNHRGTVSYGAGEMWTFLIPALLLVENTLTAEASATALNNALDTTMAAFRTGTSLGGTVVEVRILTWDSDRLYQFGDSDYLGIELELQVRVSYPVVANTA